MQLVGTVGETGWTNLDEAGDSFEEGDINLFFFEFNDIGTATVVRLRTREESSSPDSPDGPAWHLDRVCVYPGEVPQEIRIILDSPIGATQYKRRLFENALLAHPNAVVFTHDNWIYPGAYSQRGTANEWTLTEISAD